MSLTHLPEKDPAAMTRDELVSALFANLVIQQTNMAFMLLGKVPHPETGETLRDLESAKMIIDQLEMIEVKTKGNLNKQEDSLLKQSLTTLRMSFVDAVENQGPDGGSIGESKSPAPAQAQSSAPAGSPAPTSSSTPAQPPDEERQKKFTKRY